MKKIETYVLQAILEGDVLINEWEANNILEELKETKLWKNMIFNLDSHCQALSYKLVEKWLRGEE